MRKSLLIISCLFKILASSSQDFDKVIIDELNMIPVEFAIVYFSPDFDRGVYSDINGKIMIPHNVDSIKVTCTGYKDSTFSTIGDDTIFLSPATVYLEELTVKGHRKKSKNARVIGFTKSNNIRIHLPQGSESATLIKNQKIFDNYYLNSVIIKAIYHRKNDSYFRLHFYHNNDGMPGLEIPIPNQIFKIDRGKDQIINVKKLKIPLPDNGLFVSVESIQIKDSLLPELVMTKQYPIEETFIRGKLINQDWLTFRDAGLTNLIDQSINLNLCISLTVYSIH